MLRTILKACVLPAMQAEVKGSCRAMEGTVGDARLRPTHRPGCCKAPGCGRAEKVPYLRCVGGVVRIRCQDVDQPFIAFCIVYTQLAC